MYKKGLLLLLLAGALDIACRGLVYRSFPESIQHRIDYIFKRGICK